MRDLLENKYLIYIIILVSYLIRYCNLEADVPFFVQTHYIVDEGGWLHNARSKYLYDAWITHTHDNPFYVAPGYSLLLYASFLMGELSLYSARLVSVLSGTLTVLVLWVYLKRNGNLRIANSGAGFLAICGMHIIYSRLVMAEVTLTLLLMVVLLLWGERKRAGFAVLSGAVFAGMFVVKLSAIYFAPMLLILFSLEAAREELRRKDFLQFLVGSMAVGVIFVVFFVMPNQKQFLYWNVSFPLTYTEGITFKSVLEVLIFNKIDARHWTISTSSTPRYRCSLFYHFSCS